MKSRLGGAIAITAIAGVLAAGPVGAAGPGLSSYRATANAKALHVSIAGEDLTLGEAESQVDSTKKATALGAGAIEQLASKATAEATGSGSDSEGPLCSPLTLPPEVPVVDLATGCGSASASADPLESAGSGEVAGLGVSVFNDPVLGQVLGPIADEAQAALDQLLGALNPVVGPVDEALPIELENTIRDLLDALTEGGDAVTISVGPASTETWAKNGEVGAKASAAATYINILEREELGQALGIPLEPVLRIEVLPANAEVVRSLDDGSIVRRGATPAVLKLIFATDIAEDLGLPVSTIEIGTNEQLEALMSSPLFDDNGCVNPGGALPELLGGLVCVKLAHVEEYGNEGDPVVGVHATTLELRLLESLFAAGGQEGGIVLAFADALAEVEAIAAAERPRSAPPTDNERSLPRTGGGIPLAATIAVAGLAGLGLTLVRRSRPVAG